MHSSSEAPVIVPAGEGPAFWGPGDRYTFLVTGKQTEGRIFMLEAIVPPGGGPPPHIHEREDEFFYLLQGNLTVIVDGTEFPAKPGDLVHVRRGLPHTYRNIGSDNARMLAIFTPAGMEHWFEECLDRAPDTPTLPPPHGPELIARMLACGAKHGVRWA